MEIKEIIENKHSGDQDQLDVIFSEDSSIIVTAPAGCGKTTTMVSKIAWELSSGHVCPNKKILAMTYSVAGAMKIRDSLKALLPELVANSEHFLNRVDVSNYHQFAIRLLSKYGHVLHVNFNELYGFEIVDEDSRSLFTNLTDSEQRKLLDFRDALKSSDINGLNNGIGPYWNILIGKIIPAKKITYNGILIAAVYLLMNYAEISQFYKKYYQMIIVDEFQDTNHLGFLFLKNLIDNNRTVFMGDDIQRIYGFIGAVNDIFHRTKVEYNSKEFYFRTNYRFPSNPQIQALDALFRNYGVDYQASSLSANLNLNVFNTDEQEVKFIADGIKTIIDNTPDRVAVLVRAGYQGKDIAEELTQRGIAYFNCLYKDSDPEFAKFYSIAIESFHESTQNGKALLRNLKECLQQVKGRANEVTTNPERKFVFDSLFKLLEILFAKAKQWNCSPEERYVQIDFTLGNNGLKHMMEYMDERVVLSTVHAAKGLEWQYVIVPGLVSYSFPPSAVCSPCRIIYSNCNQGYKYCKCKFDNGMEKTFKEEISVFYVALTRAKKNVFFTANNGPNQWGHPKKTSCLVNLTGVSLVNYSWENSI